MIMEGTKSESHDEELDWIKIKAEIAQSRAAETGSSKMSLLLLSNPFVPLGCISTVAALLLGLRNFYKNDHKKQQFYMRARVGAQGFTILALAGGLFYHSMK